MSIMKLLYDLEVVAPFDWVSWDGARRYIGGRGLAEASVADAARMATVILRRERFSDGTVAEALADGTLPAIFSRLRRWYEHERPAA